VFESNGLMVRDGIAEVGCGTLIGENFIEDISEVKLMGCVVAKADVRAMLQQVLHVVKVTTGCPQCCRLPRKPDTHKEQFKSNNQFTVHNIFWY